MGILERTAPSGRRLLKVLATDGPVVSLASRAMVDRGEVANASSVKAALRVLEKDDLVEQGPEGWRVANPLFALWIRERAGRD